ncbi:N-acetylmuramoyl-L-alanine amidase [Lentibacillus halodurans]|uniref:N-acetylmuramoyl-L-alanine amidase n=1 Tax=Lentibacillus halodurans TaxID=237679 RepID=A0A1I0X5H9_9BACI|nr:N-acetylmuramoyl-L-alanine amidase [Lentibacillus halodurans]SFA96245.1 N-acetylmuramoyl-L-alanine amidase [Lentibacillus halodurans]
MGRIRLLIAAAGFLLFFLMFIPFVQAEDQQTYEVGTDVLNVRSAPSQSADVVGYLGNGDHVVVFQEKYGWVQTYFDGQAVWVASQYLFPVEHDIAVRSKVSSDESLVETDTASDHSTALSGLNIVLDPGHGGKDPGAIGIGGVLEKKLTINASDRVAQQLREAGANVIQTRSDDTFISLEDRVQISKANETDAFISLHYNAFPLDGVNGFSTFYDAYDDRALADDIQSGLEQHMALNSRGLMQKEYHVLRENRDASVLVELGFITNPYDMSIIETAEHQDHVAQGITEGIAAYFND